MKSVEMPMELGWPLGMTPRTVQNLTNKGREYLLLEGGESIDCCWIRNLLLPPLLMTTMKLAVERSQWMLLQKSFSTTLFSREIQLKAAGK